MLSDNRIDEWPGYFADDCVYDVISRANYERGLPLATMRYRSKGALLDRVAAIQNTLVYAPRAIAHVTGSVLILEAASGCARARSTIAVYQTVAEGDIHLLLAGRTFDDILLTSEGTLRFSQRTVIYDNERLPGALVYPV